MLQELQLPLLLLLYVLPPVHQMSVVECTSNLGTESIVSATCHWDGRLEVIWNDNDGIQIFYNCTGEVEQNGWIFGWSYGSESRTETIEGWNYYNSTCHIYGCYADFNYDTFTIPSVPCSVLTPPVQPTSTFIPPAPTPMTVYSDILEIESTSSAAPLSSDFLGEDFTSSSSHSSVRQTTSLLITAATVATIVVACLSFIFTLLFIGAMKRRNHQRHYSLHKIPFPVDDEGNIESKVYDQEDQIPHTDSVESIFDKFVENNADILKVNTVTEGSVNSIMEPDTVSECKTVPLGEEVGEEEEEEEGNEGSFKAQNLEQNGGLNLDEESTHVGSRFNFSLVHPSFHPIRSKGYTSASTSGQTSEYMYTSYSSDANTVSTNNMDYVLFPEDFAPLCDEEFNDSELCTAIPHRHNSSSSDSPSLNGRSFHPDTSLNHMQELDTVFNERRAGFPWKLATEVRNSTDIKAGNANRNNGDCYDSSRRGSEGDVVEDVIDDEREPTGGEVNDSYVGQEEVEREREERHRDSEDEAESS